MFYLLFYKFVFAQNKEKRFVFTNFHSFLLALRKKMFIFALQIRKH